VISQRVASTRRPNPFVEKSFSPGLKITGIKPFASNIIDSEKQEAYRKSGGAFEILDHKTLFKDYPILKCPNPFVEKSFSPGLKITGIKPFASNSAEP
jgi:hypothetical protein